MYCNHCGKKLEDDSLFCPYCGKKVIETDGSMPLHTEQNSGKTFNIKKKWPWILFAVLMIMLLLALIIVSYNILKKKDDKADEELTSTDFEAYYEPVDEAEISFDGNGLYVDSHLLLTASEQSSYADIESLISDLGGEVIGYISLTKDYQVNFPQGRSYEELEDIIMRLEENSLVTMVTLEYVQKLETEVVDYMTDPWRSASYPDDTGSIWNSNPDGANWWAEAILLPQVWSLQDEFKNVKIGIIDSYFDLENEDLAGVFEKVVGQDNINVTDLYQYSLRNPHEENVTPAFDVAHGSVCSGIIAAKNNEFGICGISQNAELYGISQFGEASDMNCEWASMMFWKYAIATLLNDGVRAINISMGWNKLYCFAAQQQDKGIDDRTYAIDTVKEWDSYMSEFLRRCLDNYEFLIIASAGNGNRNSFVKVDVSEEDPYGYRYAEKTDSPDMILTGQDAAYNLWACLSDENVRDHIMIIGSVDLNILTSDHGESDISTDIVEVQTVDRAYVYQSSDFSNTGERVNLYAPGGCLVEDDVKTNIGILSDYPNNQTDYMQGTSMATSMVTGTVALVWGVNPDLTAPQVKEIVELTADSQTATAGVEVVNAYKAVLEAKEIVDFSDYEFKQTAIIMGCAYDLVTDSEGNSSRENLNADMTLYNADKSEKICDIKLDERLEFFEIIDPGDYVITISCEGYEEYEAKLTLNNNQTLFYGVGMQKKEEFDEDIYREFLNDIRNIPDIMELEGLYEINYALHDLDGDDIPECILEIKSDFLYYFIYSYDEESKEVVSRASIKNWDTPGLYYSENSRLLAIATQTSDSFTYHFYEYNTEYPYCKYAYDVGWWDCKDSEVYIRYYIYNEESFCLNYVGDQERVIASYPYNDSKKKAQAENKYQEYVGDLIEISFENIPISDYAQNDTTSDSTATASLDEKIEHIRSVYYGIQYNLSAYRQEKTNGMTYYLDENGNIVKIIVPAGTYDSKQYAGADIYTAEYYYEDNQIQFVFVYSGNVEYRYYMSLEEQGGSQAMTCIRWINSDGTIYDYPEDYFLTDQFSDTSYFCGLGYMEPHWAGIW